MIERRNIYTLSQSISIILIISFFVLYCLYTQLYYLSEEGLLSLIQTGSGLDNAELS